MRSGTKNLLIFTLSVLGSGTIFAQHDASLSATRGKLVEHRSESAGRSPETEVEAAFTARLSQADGSKHGEAWLEVSADADGAQPAHLTLRIPLSSTEDAYGESRSCVEGPGGGYEPVFTAGLDEKNFVSFRASEDAHQYRLLLNKYLCRAMAAPFQCFGHTVMLPDDWSKWSLGKVSVVSLLSDAPSRLTVSPVTISSTKVPFDRAKCAVVAPSNGLCCVQHKTTQWHCGGKPSGDGWHQVSGDCYHRETGSTCTGDQPLQ